MTHRRLIVALALLFALAHLPFLPAALDDIASVNFALGIRDFDVANHRPHPPGYPVYIAFGKASAVVVGWLSTLAPASAVEARALAWLSLLAGGAAVVLLYRVYACAGLAPDGDRVGAPWARPNPRALAVVLLTAACPLFWYMGARPMSDMPGLAATLAAQACLALAWWRQRPSVDAGRRLTPEEMAASGRMIVLGALLGAFAVGVRPQALWLTTPLLLAVLIDRIGRGAAGAVLGSAMTYTIGALLWAAPLVVASGGLAAYLAALGGLAGDDVSGAERLYLHPSARLLASGLLHTFVLPWDSYWLGGIVVLLAAAGGVALAVRDRRSLVLVCLLAGPYLAVHLVFQDPAVVRDALPLVPPTVLLAVVGVGLLARRAVVPAAMALAIAALALGVPTLTAYASEPGPVRSAVSAMSEATGEPPAALGLHFAYRRPLEAESVPVSPQLPSPAGREWLELVDLWRRGVTAPVWFLADPARTDVALVDPQSRQSVRRFRWNIDSLSQMGGIRPSAVDWYVFSPPGWFASAGWALTPETAGVARAMGTGPSHGPISAWVRRRDDAARVLVGGRNLGGAGAPSTRFTLAIDGRDIESWETAPGFFLRVIDLPAGTLAGTGLAELTIVSTPVSGAEAIPTAIEQFDLQTAGSMMWGYGKGWHEAEYSPALGMWRWMSDRGELRVVDAQEPLRLTLVIEPVERSFPRPSTVTVRVGERVLASSSLDGSTPWTVEVPADALAAADGRLVLETDQVFVPADAGGPPDHRRLGLRVFSIALAPIPTAMR